MAKEVAAVLVVVVVMAAEAVVVACFLFTRISFLWYNLIGCALVVGISLFLSFLPDRRTA